MFQANGKWFSFKTKEIMKKFETLLGQVELNDARIERASGYGQYRILIDITFEGQKKQIKIHSTDSQLFDKAHGEDNHSEIVMEEADFLIEREIEDYINSL